MAEPHTMCKTAPALRLEGRGFASFLASLHLQPVLPPVPEQRLALAGLTYEGRNF